MAMNDAKQGIERVDRIYAQYKARLEKLKAERQALVLGFMRKTEEAKKEELRKLISDK